MMIFVPQPPANESDNMCRGIELYEGSRPPNTEEFQTAHLIAFCLMCALWLVSLAWFWVARNSPRLGVVRPFSLSFQLVISQILFFIGALLNHATPNLPCAIMVLCYLFALAGYGTNYFARALVFAVESQFALNAGSFVVPLLDDAASYDSFQSTTTRWSAIKSIARLALGLSALKDIPMADLVVAKRLYGRITLFFTLLPIIPFFLILVIVPQFSHCSGCPVFFEVPIVFISVLSFYLVIGVRLMYVAWRMGFPDTQGTLVELEIITIVVAPLSVIFWVTAVFDPNDLEFNRQFYYEWLWVADIGIYWIASVGVQMYAHYRQSRALKDALHKPYQVEPGVSSVPSSSASTSSHLQSFLAVLERDADIKQQFQQYAIKRYCVENLYFVEGVQNFKKFFPEKGETWRRQKVRLLYETYIKQGGSLEVNISSDTKTRLIAKLTALGITQTNPMGDRQAGSSPTSPTSAATQDLFKVFDEAMEVITRDVLQGIWQQFELERTKKERRRAKNPLRIVSTPQSPISKRTSKATSSALSSSAV